MIIVALDVGNARIGVAVSDDLEQIATPHATIRRTSNAAALDAIIRLVSEAAAGLVVLGLPVSLDGSLNAQARSVMSFGRKLVKRLRVPLIYADETLSSVRAEEMLRAAGVRPKRIRERIDAAAAAVILQDYLDTRQTVDPDAMSRTSPGAEARRLDAEEEGNAEE